MLPGSRLDLLLGDRAAVLRAAGIGLLNTLPGLIVTYAAFAFPFTVFFLYAFFRSLSKSIAEAAAGTAQVSGGPSSRSCCPWPGRVWLPLRF